jgi:hypothetical protein
MKLFINELIQFASPGVPVGGMVEIMGVFEWMVLFCTVFTHCETLLSPAPVLGVRQFVAPVFAPALSRMAQWVTPLIKYGIISEHKAGIGPS